MRSLRARVEAWLWDWSAPGWEYHEDPRLLGEDENGVLFVPSRTRPNWWDRRLDLRRPTHWPYYLRSRRRRAVTGIESA